MAYQTKNSSRERPQKPVTERYLQNAAIYYLGRFASSAANLGQVLERKVRRRNEDHHRPTQEQMDWIGAVVEKCVTLGLVDDTEYARNRALSLHNSGKSERRIKDGLKQKGVGPEDIENAIAELRRDKGEGLEMSAAIAYARRRRFGPFRSGEADTDKMRRELASFARAGFGFSLSKRIVEAASPDGLEDV
jgi:regulatory protein